MPSSPLLPAALPALLAALTAACQQGGDAALANRLKALITALTKAKAESTTQTSTEALTIPEGEGMAALLRRTLYLASRHKDKKVTAAAAAAFCYLLRSSITAEGGHSSFIKAADTVLLGLLCALMPRLPKTEPELQIIGCSSALDNTALSRMS